MAVGDRVCLAFGLNADQTIGGEKGYIDDDEAATRARHGKNFGPTRYLNFIFSIHGMKSNKDMLFKLPTALDPANAYKRDGTASNTGSKSAKDILLKGSTIFNSSTAFKRDGSTKILVNVADGSVNFSTSTKVEFLLFYFMANLGLTLYNKYIMLKVRLLISSTLDITDTTQHSSPYLLTALHCLSGVIGTQVLFRSGAFTLKPLTTKDKLRLSLFSILYTLNIAVSNASL